jgi:hypothetical protein
LQQVYAASVLLSGAAATQPQVGIASALVETTRTAQEGLAQDSIVMLAGKIRHTFENMSVDLPPNPCT